MPGIMPLRSLPTITVKFAAVLLVRAHGAHPIVDQAAPRDSGHVDLFQCVAAWRANAPAANLHFKPKLRDERGIGNPGRRDWVMGSWSVMGRRPGPSGCRG